MQWFDDLKQWRYFHELAFIVALFLLLWAWKFGLEGIIEGALE